MAIKLTTLESALQNTSQASSKSNYTFQDLHLDIQRQEILQGGYQDSIYGRDLKVDWDEKAIYNSLRNIFHTLPGQRPLFPTFGSDLHQFLFTGITEGNAEILGQIIVNNIEQFEPRVIVNTVNVGINADQNQYDIMIEISIPTIRKNVTIFGAASLESGITFFETSYNV